MDQNYILFAEYQHYKYPARMIHQMTVPDILYEDNHLIAINKRSGDLSQPDSSGKLSLQDIIIAYIRERDHKPGNVYLGTLHRLDQPVSGVLLFAKTSKAASRMALSIRERRLEKFYFALTAPSQGLTRLDSWTVFDDPLIREGDRTFVRDTFLSERGILMMRKLTEGPTYDIHLIRLVTGKKHQIRAQLSHRNMTILGDTRYGSAFTGSTGIALHSILIAFEHPIKKVPTDIFAPIQSNVSDVLNLDPSIAIPDNNEIMTLCKTEYIL
jgi:23S rRNA pseudouridine1911/1915/1917 synthase